MLLTPERASNMAIRAYAAASEPLVLTFDIVILEHMTDMKNNAVAGNIFDIDMAEMKNDRGDTGEALRDHRDAHRDAPLWLPRYLRVDAHDVNIH